MARRNFSVKYCRHCGRLIALDSVDCPYCHKNTIRHHEEAICPFCREPIRAGALKCRYCGEFIDGSDHVTPGAGRAAETTVEPVPQVRAEPAREQIPQTVIYIEKAIIAGTDEQGRPRLLRPDGKMLTEGDLAASRDRADAQTLPPGAVGGALPPGPETTLQKAQAPPPARAAPPAPPAPAAPRRKRRRLPALRLPRLRPRRSRKKERKTFQGPVPPVQYECPSCRGYVYESDNFCENCGRDLKLHPKRREFPRARRYGGADLTIILGLGTPLGVLGPEGTVTVIGVAAVAVGLWSVLRISGSHGELKGIPRAAFGLLCGLSWLLLIAVFG